MPYNVGIIGAARRHQGTGPFIARNFVQHGHHIAGIVGTSQTTAFEAQTNLKKEYDIDSQAYTSLDQLTEEHAIDIVVISSPPNSHLKYLEKALDNKCHVFCEKPLWWPQETLSQEDYIYKIDQIISVANKNKCYIHLNTQWPYTLKDFIRLYPDSLRNHQLNQFTMTLSPQSSGVDMLVDAASHGLSMLYQLVGHGEITNLNIEHIDSKALVNFDYQHQTGITNTSLEFIQSNETPKPASYQINGYLVKRIVALPEYQIQLQSGQKIIDIHDPLDRSIEDFLAGIDAQISTDEITLRLGALHLHQLIEAFI